MVVDLVGHAADAGGAHVVPLARQTGVALCAIGGLAVLQQVVQNECIGAGAIDHKLHFVQAAGAGGAARGAGKAIRRHGAGRAAGAHGGAGVGAAQAQYVVGTQRQSAGALQGHHFHFLDRLDGLVAPQGAQIQQCARGQPERVHTLSTVDEAACSQFGLDVGACCDDVVARQ